jgi:hypothetical protein
MDTISSFNNHIPCRSQDTPFKIWLYSNNRHLRCVFEIFLNELEEINDTEKNYIKFCRKVYNKSSGVLV